MRRTLGVMLAVMALALLAARPAVATFHLMQIEQVIGGVDGNTNVQAIQLRMRSSFQNQMHNARLIVRNAAGASPILLVDFTTPVTAHGAGVHVLAATENLDSFTNPPLTPDFTLANTIPASYLAAGSLTFEDDFGTIYWRLSWGGAGYTGTGAGAFDNDGDGDFNPSFSGPLPSSSGRALLFGGSATAGSTTNASQYALTPVAATLTANDDGIGQITSTVGVGEEIGLGVELGPAIPNPAQSAVSYSVTLPRAGHIKVRAFDLRGRAVRTLVDRDFPSGRHGLTWEITSDSPSLSSGIYLLVLEAEGRRMVRRVTYLRGTPLKEHHD